MSDRRSRGNDRFHALRRIALLLIWVLLVVAPAVAGEPAFSVSLKAPAAAISLPRVEVAPPSIWKGADSSTFYRSHFLPELQQEFAKIGPVALTSVANQAISMHVLYDEYTRQAQRRMERATQDSLKNYLLETTTLGKLNEVFSSKRGPGNQRPEGREVSFGLGISGGVPQVEMRYKLFSASLRISVGVHGEAKVEIRTHQLGETHLVTRYDPRRNEYGLACRFGF